MTEPLKSGAIIEYLLDTYDKDHLISVPDPLERNLLRQWIYFQIAFQGPVLSNVFFFTHIDPNTKARAHLVKESNRILHVLDQALRDREWLVGDKCSAADLIYLPFQMGTGVSCHSSLPGGVP